MNRGSASGRIGSLGAAAFAAGGVGDGGETLAAILEIGGRSTIMETIWLPTGGPPARSDSGTWAARDAAAARPPRRGRRAAPRHDRDQQFVIVYSPRAFAVDLASRP
ncbi:hypothetical protein GS502_07285 [Rhodococcus hoagii]|nr:hypothetical protein [Prescottella equi]